MSPLFRSSARSLSLFWLLSPLAAEAAPSSSQPPNVIEPALSPTSRLELVDFRPVARAAIPAVVSIKVKMTAGSEPSSRWGGNAEDNQEFFSDDFWQFFFGAPPNRRRREGNPSLTPRGGEPILSQASGFIVSEDGYILTNSHVVSDAQKVSVVLNDGREFDATIIGHDPNTDIGLIKIPAEGLPALKLGDSDALEIGEWVLAVGNPLGLQASVTAGIVSAKGRNNLDIARVEDFIQTDAAINRGNSGGPLLRADGTVIGINTAIVTNMATGGYMGIGFSVPSLMAKHVMEELLEHGKVVRGYIGVSLQQLDADLAQAFGISRTQGALVVEVMKGSPADEGGLQQGDVIIEQEGKPVNNIAALRNAVSMMSPGSSLPLTILREGNRKQLTLKITSFPGSDPTAVVAVERFGFQIEEITPQLAEKLGGIPTGRGVIVSRVTPGSAAALVGLKKGAVILKVNKQEVNSEESFRKALAETPKGTPLLLLVQQGGTTRFVSLKVD